MSPLFSINKSPLLLITLLLASSALAEQQSGGAPLSNCVPDGDSALTPAVVTATSSTGSIVAHVVGGETTTGAIPPSFLTGGAGGYGANKVKAGDHFVLFLGGTSRAGTDKSYFAPAAIGYYAFTDKFQAGIGQNGFTGSSSADGSSSHGAGDLALNAEYTFHQSKGGAVAVAALVNSNINLGHHAYEEGLTAHSGISPGVIATLTPKNGNSSFNLGVVGAVPIGAKADSGTGFILTNTEWDHQFTKEKWLKNIVGSLGVQTENGNGAGTITPSATATYTHGSNQFAVGYSEDTRTPAGEDKAKSWTFGYLRDF